MRFQVGDLVRCKKKFSRFQREPVNMNGLCRVFSIMEKPQNRTIYDERQNKYLRAKINIVVEVVAHVKDGQKNGHWDVWDYHFRRANEKDRQQFILYSL